MFASTTSGGFGPDAASFSVACRSVNDFATRLILMSGYFFWNCGVQLVHRVVLAAADLLVPDEQRDRRALGRLRAVRRAGRAAPAREREQRRDRRKRDETLRDSPRGSCTLLCRCGLHDRRVELGEGALELVERGRAARPRWPFARRGRRRPTARRSRSCERQPFQVPPDVRRGEQVARASRVADLHRRRRTVERPRRRDAATAPSAPHADDRGRNVLGERERGRLGRRPRRSAARPRAVREQRARATEPRRQRTRRGARLRDRRRRVREHIRREPEASWSRSATTARGAQALDARPARRATRARRSRTPARRRAGRTTVTGVRAALRARRTMTPSRLEQLAQRHGRRRRARAAPTIATRSPSRASPMAVIAAPPGVSCSSRAKRSLPGRRQLVEPLERQVEEDRAGADDVDARSCEQLRQLGTPGARSASKMRRATFTDGTSGCSASACTRELARARERRADRQSARPP